MAKNHERNGVYPKPITLRLDDADTAILDAVAGHYSNRIRKPVTRSEMIRTLIQRAGRVYGVSPRKAVRK